MNLKNLNGLIMPVGDKRTIVQYFEDLPLYLKGYWFLVLWAISFWAIVMITGWSQ